MPSVPANRGGEAHFSASSWAVLYYQVLFLAGQFEAAVVFLYVSGLETHYHVEELACLRQEQIMTRFS